MRTALVEIFDRNGFIHLFIIALVVTCCLIYGFWYAFLYPVILLVLELMNYVGGLSIFNPEKRIQRGYVVSSFFNDSLFGQGIDYGFNFYNGEYSKSREKAQCDKFEYAIKKLNLEPGMWVIDIGCGCGDWLDYLHSKGMNVVGINITRVQVEVCRTRGLDVVWINWKDIDKDKQLRRKLYGKFDAVTFWDTVEHYVPMKYRENISAQDKIYSDMFSFAYKLIRPDSKSQKVFISCLHQRQNILRQKMSIKKLKTMYYIYLLDTFHSGYYPDGETDQLVMNAKDYFELEHRLDTTMDYYMTSVLEPTHFGTHRFKWNAERIVLAVLFLFTHSNMWLIRLLVAMTNSVKKSVLFSLIGKTVAYGYHCAISSDAEN
ncbi:MAG: class I SAM-dependent methyltransferase [Deltaproteobacteria bacterium]|nr:class I SAM-dependent methyltransferase [Deltaproteobacteria bacterium]